MGNDWIECTWKWNFLYQHAWTHEHVSEVFCNILHISQWFNLFTLSLLVFMCNLSLRIEGSFLVKFSFFIFHLLFFCFSLARIVLKINHFSLNGKTKKLSQFFFNFIVFNKSWDIFFVFNLRKSLLIAVSTILWSVKC